MYKNVNENDSEILLLQELMEQQEKNKYGTSGHSQHISIFLFPRIEFKP